MAYTSAQLVAAYTAANAGVAPDAATTALLGAFATQTQTGQLSDSAALAYVLNSADNDVNVAVQAYQFFTGKTPTKAGLDYLVNSTTNTTDLNDPYYAQFNIENRYLNFAVNLGVVGEGAAAFNTSYGSMNFNTFVGVAYETIIGSSYAQAAGINVAAAIADITSRKAAFEAVARQAGVINASSTAAQVDIATKAALIGYLMVEGIKADVGLYAAGANNFVNALVNGTAQYNVNLTTVYSPLGGGTGAPGGGAVPVGSTFALTTSSDALAGTSSNDTFNAGISIAADGTTAVNTLQAFDSVNGGAGVDTLNATLTGGALITPQLTSVDNVIVRSTAAGSGIDLTAATGTTAVGFANSTASGRIDAIGAANTISISNQAVATAIGGTAGTATSLTLNFTNATKGSSLDLGVTNASAATTLTINTDTSNVEINSTKADVATSATINATGTNTIKFTDSAATLKTVTVNGTGSADISGQALTALLTLTAGNGGVTASITNAGLTTVTTGSGKDSITLGAALGAGATVNVGAGDDTVKFTAAPTKGATVTAGDGTDTLSVTDAIYTAVAAFATADQAKIAGFETLSISDAAAGGGTYSLLALNGTTFNNFALEAGVATTKTTTVTNVSSGANISLSGNLTAGSADGALVVQGTAAVTTGTTDSVTLTLKSSDILNNNAAVTATTTGFETVNLVTAGATADANTTKAYVVGLTDNDITALKVSGTRSASFTAAAGMTKLATIDASGLTGAGTTAIGGQTATIDVSAVTNTSAGVKVTGSAQNDTFTVKDFAIITGNGGDDTAVIAASTNGNSYSVLQDFSTNDKVTFAAGTSFVAPKIALAGTAVFQDYLDAATVGNASHKVSWFQFGGDTYLVEDSAAGATFTNGTDSIVKLVGLHDLSTSATTFAGGTVTLGA